MDGDQIVALVASISTAVVTLAGLYFKHRLDMEDYRRLHRRVDKVQHTLENGISTSLADTNAKVTDVAAAMAPQKDGSE